MGAQIGVEYALGGHDVVLYARDTSRRERVEPARLPLRAPRVADARRGRAQARIADLHGRDGRGGQPRDADLARRVASRGPRAQDARSSATCPGRRSPDAVVATNTSSLSITALGEAIGAPERTVGTHYLNPPLLMPPVEIVAGEQPSSATRSRSRETPSPRSASCPLWSSRDVPGFVWNRLQFALVRECAWLVEHGVATPEDVDTVVREGLARRWRHVGPLRAIALGGIETWNRSGANIVPELSTALELPDLGQVAIDGRRPRRRRGRTRRRRSRASYASRPPIDPARSRHRGPLPPLRGPDGGCGRCAKEAPPRSARRRRSLLRNPRWP